MDLILSDYKILIEDKLIEAELTNPDLGKIIVEGSAQILHFGPHGRMLVCIDLLVDCERQPTEEEKKVLMHDLEWHISREVIASICKESEDIQFISFN